VQVGGDLGEEQLHAVGQGVQAPEGDFLGVKDIRIIRKGDKNTWLEIVLDEGKNRHIRRLLGVFGIEVLRLIRVAIGPLQLGKLAKGEHRLLSAAEKRALDAAMKNR
jgi:23S rRNA pseudouridine2605 synthase